MWNQPSAGLLPSRAGGISFPESRFQPLPDQGMNALQDAIKAIGGLLEKQRQDKIANQLLASDTAQRATAVDGTEPTMDGPQPDAALTQEMVAHNMRLGAPTTAGQPDLGGADMLEAKLKHDTVMAKIAESLSQSGEHDAMANYYNAGGSGAYRTTGSSAGKIYNEYAGGYVTPSENARIKASLGKPTKNAFDPVELQTWKDDLKVYNENRAFLQKSLPSGVTPEEFSQIGPVKFVAAVKIKGAKDANGNPMVIEPGTALSEADAERITAAQTTAAKVKGHNARGFIQATGTTPSGQPFTTDFEDFRKLHGLAKALKKPTPPKPIKGGAAAMAESDDEEGGGADTVEGYPTPTAEAVAHLQQHPDLAPQFEEMYGPGSSNGLTR